MRSLPIAVIMSANQFAPLASVQGGQQNGRPNRTGKARSGGIVGGALRGAGLVDEDSGMRDAGSTGPRRAGRGPELSRTGNPLSVSKKYNAKSNKVDIASGIMLNIQLGTF